MNDYDARKIADLLAEFLRLGIGEQLGYERLHEYSIITHSTAIEGSTVTFEENELMFDEGIIPFGKTLHEQMMNLDLRGAYAVMREVVQARTPITPALLKGLSALVMRNTGTLYRTLNGEYDEAKGEFRLQNVSAGRGGRSYLAWQKVESSTALFCDWLRNQLEQVDELAPAEVYQLSFEAHFRLVTIHPWSDGNGRMARLLMNLVQLEGNVVPSYVRNEVRAEYLASLREAQEVGQSTPFCDFMARETIANLEREIAQYRQSVDGALPWAEE